MLAYTKLWLDTNGDHSWLHVRPRISVVFQYVCSCCPLLAVGPYELSFLVADDATVRSAFCRILRSACRADSSNVAHIEMLGAAQPVAVSSCCMHAILHMTCMDEDEDQMTKGEMFLCHRSCGHLLRQHVPIVCTVMFLSFFGVS